VPAWYDRAFGSWYLRLYPHRDREEARRLAEFLGPRLPGAGRILDVACGAGRHVEALGGQGADVFGIDRSRVLLAEAPDPIRHRLTRGDMRRLPYPDRAFAAALSLFTSFGYFADRRAHLDLLAEIGRVLEHGGLFVLDYANAPRVRATLIPRSERLVDGHAVVEERRIVSGGDGERMVKTVIIAGPGGGEVERYQESVALYEPDAVAGMVGGSGFRVLGRFGDYDGSPWGPGSDRVLLLAERTAA